MTTTSLHLLAQLTAADLEASTGAALDDDPASAIAVLRGSRTRRASYAAAAATARARVTGGRGLRVAAARLQLLAALHDTGSHCDTLARHVAMGLLGGSRDALGEDLATLRAAGCLRLRELPDLTGPAWSAEERGVGLRLQVCRDHLAAACHACAPSRSAARGTPEVCRDLVESILAATRYAGRVA